MENNDKKVKTVPVENTPVKKQTVQTVKKSGKQVTVVSIQK